MKIDILENNRSHRNSATFMEPPQIDNDLRYSRSYFLNQNTSTHKINKKNEANYK